MKDATHKEVTATGVYLYKVNGDKVYREGCFGNWVLLDITCPALAFVAHMQKIDEPDVIHRSHNRFYKQSKWDGVVEK